MFVIEGVAGSGVSIEIVKILNTLKDGTKVLILDESSQPYSGLSKSLDLQFLEANTEGISYSEFIQVSKKYEVVVVNTSIVNLETLKELESIMHLEIPIKYSTIFIAKVQSPVTSDKEIKEYVDLGILI